jgi:hypothetical protein
LTRSERGREKGLRTGKRELYVGSANVPERQCFGAAAGRSSNQRLDSGRRTVVLIFCREKERWKDRVREAKREDDE